LLFETEDGKSGLEQLISKRTQQHTSTKADLMRLLTGLEGLMLLESKSIQDGVGN
jgi:hypothetical protein